MEIDKLRRQRFAEFKKSHDEVIVMAIKPKYAKAIYEGRKHWEFRKAPPPVCRTIALYESAPVSAVTGSVVFSCAITGCPSAVWELARRNRSFAKNNTGIGEDEFREYCGGKRVVSALRVFEAHRWEKPIKSDIRPPQNWGKFYFRKEEAAT